ncbi:vWA domain-containing protein [Butyrivibrio sp. AC2005]|uniref:vWA domain-containing protein n=1 Tax=Butyrivibrio sp. AC2005 TaxID=1280672 RepID=UPI00041B7A6C|nr:hypothetical protein [Butyrivibrio sp. AC2005]
MAGVDYFYIVIDVSESMQGNRIGAVNDAVNNIVFRLKRIKAAKGIIPQIISLTYSVDVQWSTPFPVDVVSFVYCDPLVVGKASNMAKALLELETKLDRQSQAVSAQESNTTIIYFTDGLVTDNLAEARDKLFNNRVYKEAKKIAVTFGDELTLDIAKENLLTILDSEKDIVVDDFVELNRIIFEQYK